MIRPRVTIGIPTLGARPAMLKRAVASALAQSPAKATVLIADQSGDGRVVEALGPMAQDPFVRIVPTHERASCLWQNWTAAAENCDTEFFAWLQDDDVVAPHFCHRIVQCFDQHPKAQTWLARVGISMTDGAGANWWQSSGPLIPMDLLYGQPTEIRGSLLMAGSYFNTWALSPGVAIRWSLDTVNACRACPTDCDLFVERSILAELGRLGPAICDPAMVGYWIQHTGNESRKQIAEGTTRAQFLAFARHLDPILAGSSGWESQLYGWATLMERGQIARWLDDTSGYDDAPESLHVARTVLQAVVQPPASAEPVPIQPETATSKAPRRARKAVALNRE